MKKNIILFVLLSSVAISVKGLVPDAKHHNSSGINYIDSVQKDIALHLPAGWTIKRYDRRLVVCRTDSAYMEFEQPMNQDYSYESGKSAKDKWSSLSKYKIEMYIDFTLESWTDSTVNVAKMHNDSIEKEIGKVQAKYSKAHSGMAGYDRMRTEKRLLQAQLIKTPVAIRQYAVFISDNSPQGAEFYDTSSSHHNLSRQIIVVRSVCAEVVAVKMGE